MVSSEGLGALGPLAEQVHRSVPRNLELQLEAVDGAFRAPRDWPLVVWVSVGSELELEAGGNGLVVSIRAHAHEEHIPRSSPGLLSWKLVPTANISATRPAAFLVDCVLLAQLYRLEVDVWSTAPKSPAPGREESRGELHETHSIVSSPRAREN